MEQVTPALVLIFGRAVDPGLILYATAVLFFAYLVRGIAGFGSGLIAVPLLSLAFPLTSVVPMVVALDYIGSFGQGAKNLERIIWKEQFALVPFMLIGISLGFFVFWAIPSSVLSKMLGGFVIVYAVYQLLSLPSLGTSKWIAAACGVFGGLVGTLFGTGGPFYVMYFSVRNLNKDAFRATFAANFMIDGGIRLVSYFVVGLLGFETLACVLVALPIIVAGLYLGGRIHTGLSQQSFARIVNILLLGSGTIVLLR